MAASCGGHASADYAKFGLETNHAYSILYVCSLEVEGFLQLLQLRNPWGMGTWKGRLSDCDLVWEQNTLLKETLNYRCGEKGIFRIQFSDFTR